MGLQDLVRAGISIANNMTSSLQADVVHRAWTSDGFSNAPVYNAGGAGTTRAALVNMQQRLIVREGKEVLQVASLTFVEPIAAHGATGRREPIDPRDLFVLPSGQTATVLWVKGLVDPDTDAPYMLEVGLG